MFDTATIEAKSQQNQPFVAFDASKEACQPFGFNFGDRVLTPHGTAWVLGVNDGELHFTMDAYGKPAKWSGYMAHEFRAQGFRLLFSPANDTSTSDPNRFCANVLGPLVDAQEYSDVVFVLDRDQRVYAHKGILVKRSEYFRVLFTTGAASCKSEIRIEGLDKAAFTDCLTFLYTGSCVKIDLKSGANLLRAAHMFMLEDLKRECARELSKQVTVETVLEILVLCEQQGLVELKTMCIEYLLNNLHVPALRASVGKLISSQLPDLVEKTRSVTASSSSNNSNSGSATRWEGKTC